MCYEKQYYEHKNTTASQPKKQDARHDAVVTTLLKDAEKAGQKAKEDAQPAKEPLPVK